MNQDTQHYWMAAFDLFSSPVDMVVVFVVYVGIFPLRANKLYKRSIEQVIEQNSELPHHELVILLKSRFRTDIEKGNKKMSKYQDP